jgi:hypothetical protein
MRVLANDIHDPYGNNDHLAEVFAAERLFYRIEAQNGSLNFRILGIATPFLARKQTNRLLFSLLVLFNSLGRERAIVRQWLVALIVWISECITCYGQTTLLLFGDNEHQTFLGCLNCSKFDSTSICNKFGQLGSLFTSDSIWNASGRFGSSSDSPWNVFSTSGPVIVDESGQFYGRFTASKFVSDRTRIRALNQLTDLVAGGMNLKDAHERFRGD